MRGGSGGVSLVIPVRSRYNNLELVAGLAEVGGTRGVDRGAPEGTLVVGDGRWVWAVAAPTHIRAVSGGVNRRVALDVDVEGRTQIRIIAKRRAAADVVGGEGFVSEVGVGARGGVEVLEDLLVAGRGLGVQSIGFEFGIGVEGCDGVGLDLRAGAGGLRGAGVFGVDEAAVGSCFGGGGAGGG